jgi:hypothetical protein
MGATNSRQLDEEAAVACVNALTKTLLKLDSNAGGVEMWNDHPNTTYADVIRLIDLTIEDELKG